MEQDSRMKFLKLLGYSKDELQKKVSCFDIRITYLVCREEENPVSENRLRIPLPGLH